MKMREKILVKIKKIKNTQSVASISFDIRFISYQEIPIYIHKEKSFVEMIISFISRKNIYTN